MRFSKIIILCILISGILVLTGMHISASFPDTKISVPSEIIKPDQEPGQEGQAYQAAPATSFSDMLKIYWWRFLLIFLVLSAVIAWASYKLVKIKHSQSLPDPGTFAQEFQEENLLYTLIDNMPDYIYIKDTKSRFIVSNQKIANVHGIKSPRMMKGKTDYDFYPKEMANQFYWDEQEIITSGKPLVNHEEKALNEKGEEIYLSTTKIPLRNSSGEIIGLVGIGRDISDRKKVEKKLVQHAEELQHVNTLLEEKQEEIFQQSEELSAQADSLSQVNQELEKLSVVARETDNVVIILDKDGNFEWINNSFTRIYGATLEDFVKEKGRNILESSFNPYINDIVHKCRESKETIRYQSEEKLKDGRTVWMQSTLTPILDDNKNIVRFVAVDSDITAIKKAQELISQQKEEIENQRDKLEKLNKTKDKFFSIIAHDLRNPFHSILGFADLLIKNYREIEDEKKQEYIQLMHESSQYAYHLLENLLHWSRSQTERIQFSPVNVDLFEIIDEINHMLLASFKKKDITFSNEIPEGTLVFGDKNMISTIVSNLVNNATKFTPDGGSIKVFHEATDQDITIHISDTGIGMEQKVIDKLFNLDQFYSTTGTDGESGTGLGLIVIHEFVKKHNGTISVKSKPGKGSTFSITLPGSKMKK